MICGARGDPGTVAPFRAWRGSRDLVAQSPKFHAPAVAHHATANRSLTYSIAEEMGRQLFGGNIPQRLFVNRRECTAIEFAMIGYSYRLMRA